MSHYCTLCSEAALSLKTSPMRLAGVYVMTNEPGGNDILVFGRGPDGALSQIQTVSTQEKVATLAQPVSLCIGSSGGSLTGSEVQGGTLNEVTVVSGLAISIQGIAAG